MLLNVFHSLRRRTVNSFAVVYKTGIKVDITFSPFFKDNSRVQNMAPSA